ncbi:hypothetical protein IC229_35035 [Spirosoma sp. BT702]|uniref:Uncharacterized protein n=1 Tax=Spirosoma profusum TaxID=2771354 RepID=A0A927AWX1_9BACT|nr:hypothetical protein [Spirosoma profusum]MBD2705866.1 hypothetical protein [Spirosoma profusum]
MRGNIFIAYLAQTLFEGEKENKLLIDQTEAAVDGLKRQLTELDDFTPKNRTIFEVLGLTNGMNAIQQKVFENSIRQIGEAIQSTTQLIIEQSETRISELEAQIQAKQEQISVEEQRDKEGYANNLALRKAELEDLKRQKAEEEAIKRKALQVQQSIDLAAQISNAAVTVSEGVRFLTSYAARSAVLGPIAGPIAYFATIASILASIYAVTNSFKNITKLREGGKVRGAKHEQGGVRGTSAFGDIELEGGEHVINARSSDRYDETLEALNRNDPREAFAALVREGNIGLPALIVQHINRPDFMTATPAVDLGSLSAKIEEGNELSRNMLSQLKKAGSKKQRTTVAPGIMIVEEGNHTSYQDLRPELRQKGIKID